MEEPVPEKPGEQAQKGTSGAQGLQSPSTIKNLLEEVEDWAAAGDQAKMQGTT